MNFVKGPEFMQSLKRLVSRKFFFVCESDQCKGEEGRCSVLTSSQVRRSPREPFGSMISMPLWNLRDAESRMPKKVKSLAEAVCWWQNKEIRLPTFQTFMMFSVS